MAARPSFALSAAALTIALSCALFASDMRAEEASDWRYEITLYGWIPEFTGTVGETSSSPDIGLVEFEAESLLEQTDMAFFGNARIRRGDVFLFGDTVYANLSDTGATRGPILESVRTRIKAASAIVGAGYSFAHWDGGHADAMAGVRYVSVDAELRVSNNRREVSVSADIDWFEPTLGVGARHDLSDRWYLEGNAYVGGFGAGSDFTSDLYAAAGYRFNDWASGIIGFRWLSVDYDDAFRLDVDLYGPLIGAAAHF